MSRAVGYAWFPLLLVLTGCTKDEDYLDVFRAQRLAWNEMASILESVKDEKSMADARAALEDRAKKFEAISRKAKALPNPPPPEVLKRLEDDRLAMQSTVKRLHGEVKRVRELPGGAEFLKQFDSHSPGLLSAVQP